MPDYDAFIKIDKDLLSEILTEHALYNQHLDEREFIVVGQIDFNENDQSMVVHIDVNRRTEH